MFAREVQSHRPSLCLCLSVVSSFLLLISTGLAQNVVSARKALILYDGQSTGYSDGLISANSIANLLGHFSANYDIQPVGDYQSGRVENYAWIFFAGNVEKTQLPKAFLDDLASTSKTICWLNRHVNQLTANPRFSQKAGFRFIDFLDNEEFDGVLYNGITLRKTDSDLNLIRIENKALCRVWAQTRSSAGLLPYIVQSGNFWYVADSPFSFVEEGDRYLAFCDVLHEILGAPHPVERKALVRIEDVSIDDDPIELRRVADYLSAQRVPFQIALIPIFKDPSKGIELYLSDRPQFVETIQYMTARGGSVVLHGVTHQFRGTSADDFEFWDDLQDKPLSFESEDWVRKKIELGMNECFKNGIYPIAWESPHYGSSFLAQRVFKEFFSHVNERRMVIEKLGTQQYFPYPLTDIHGQKIIPENLGYVSIEAPNPQRLVDDARKMLAVRDGMPSFFFHSFVSLQHLKTIVEGVKRQGYQFVSLKSFGCQAVTRNRAVTTLSGPVRLNLDQEYLRAVTLDSRDRVVAENVSVAPFSGVVERKVSVGSGQMVVFEGLLEKPETTQPSWFEQWRSKLARFGFWTEESQKQQELAGEATLVWMESSPSSLARSRAGEGAGLLDFRENPVLGGVAQGARVGPLRGPQPTPGAFGSVPSREGNRILSSSSVVSHQGETSELAELNDQESFRSALNAFGIRVRLLQVDKVESAAASLSKVVVVPYVSAKRLTDVARQALLRHVQAGGRLVLDGETELASQLGIRFEGRRLSAKRIHDLNFPDIPVEWKPAADFPKFAATKGAKPLFVEPESQSVLGVLGQHGDGRYLFLGPLFDPHSALGISRFPSLFQTLRTSFGLQPLARRPQLEVYFDPGLRAGISIERLVRSWRSFGVKVVYAAAWAADYRRWDFNYPYFIDLCHKNGILVYAWFELPQVNEKFWDAHPEWREKTATGASSYGSWRLLMNLQNRDCRRAAIAAVLSVLGQFAWDGVNIAELNYDTDHGPLNPAKYVPMNDDVRRDFAAARGFDPRLLFDATSPYFWKKNPEAFEQFDRYRSEIVTSWHREILEALGPACQRNQWELVVTMLDSLHSATLTRDTGVNSESILALMKKHPFTLQVEDPAEFWSQPPDRYARFVATYLKRVPDRTRLVFDLNIIPSRNTARTLLPTNAQTGLEFAQMLHHASQASGRVAVYAESTLLPQDFEVMESVLAHGAEVSVQPDRLVVDTPRTVLVRVDPQKTYQLDGQPWPFREFRQLMVPAGKHAIVEGRRKRQWIDWSQLTLTLKSLHGELLEGSATPRGLRFRYSAPTRAVALLSKQPYQVWLDGREFAVKAGFYQGDWSIHLPPGEHQVEVFANSPAYFLLDLTSLFSSSLIVLAGFGIGGALSLLYVTVLLRRWLRSRWLWAVRWRATLAKNPK